MKILDRYLAGRFFSSWLGVNLVLAGLFSFLELARQLDDVGRGRYAVRDALLYVALTLPGRMMDLAPPCTLIACIIALGLLARNLELLALRTSGISMQRVGWAFARPALLMVLSLLVGAQFIIPILEQAAWTLRETALAESGTMLPHGGFWTRDEKRFVNLRSARDTGLQDVDIYELDDQGQLSAYIHARETHIDAEGNWSLHEVQRKAKCPSSFFPISSPANRPPCWLCLLKPFLSRNCSPSSPISRKESRMPNATGWPFGKS